VERILNNQDPSAIVFAPNYWQWFSHHRNHGTLPDELKHCGSQLDMINHLGLDVFSRNIYCRQDDYWFGGLCEEHFNGIRVEAVTAFENRNKITDKAYHLGTGMLTEQLNYVFNESTVVQKKFLITDYNQQGRLLEQFVASRSWKFSETKYLKIKELVGDKGMVIVGDFFSPLKMLHLVMGPILSVYFLMEQPDFAQALLDLHEKAQLDLVKQVAGKGVKAIMAMDNLDTVSSQRIRWVDLIRLKQTIAICSTRFISDWVWWFFLFWIPDFLNKAHGIDMKELVLPVIVIYAVSSIGGIGGGWLSSKLISSGRSIDFSRKTSILICALIILPVMLVSQTHQLWIAVALIAMAAAGHQGWASNIFTIVSDIYPKRAVGTMVGLSGFAGAVGGALSASFVGLILENTGSYFLIFLIASSVYLINWLILKIFLKEIKPMTGLFEKHVQ
jgi:hypothetical protein